jgi:hypothetical protein
MSSEFILILLHYRWKRTTSNCKLARLTMVEVKKKKDTDIPLTGRGGL